MLQGLKETCAGAALQALATVSRSRTDTADLSPNRKLGVLVAASRFNSAMFEGMRRGVRELAAELLPAGARDWRGFAMSKSAERPPMASGQRARS